MSKGTGKGTTQPYYASCAHQLFLIHSSFCLPESPAFLFTEPHPSSTTTAMLSCLSSCISPLHLPLQQPVFPGHSTSTAVNFLFILNFASSRHHLPLSNQQQRLLELSQVYFIQASVLLSLPPYHRRCVCGLG